MGGKPSKGTPKDRRLKENGGGQHMPGMPKGMSGMSKMPKMPKNMGGMGK